MKKTLLAAAILTTFAGVAQAETSVTLYGIIDTGIGYNKVSGTEPGINLGTGKPQNVDVSGSRIGMINGVQSGSRWGLKGSEDLGDGLRAMFQLESGFDSGNGDTTLDRLFGRQAPSAWPTMPGGRLNSAVKPPWVRTSWRKSIPSPPASPKRTSARA